MAFKSGNLELSILMRVLEHEGCKMIRHSHGHYKYTRSDLLRPIVIQDHIDPVPAFIVKQIMRTLKMKNSDMSRALSEI